MRAAHQATCKRATGVCWLSWLSVPSMESRVGETFAGILVCTGCCLIHTLLSRLRMMRDCLCPGACYDALAV